MLFFMGGDDTAEAKVGANHMLAQMTKKTLAIDVSPRVDIHHPYGYHARMQDAGILVNNILYVER